MGADWYESLVLYGYAVELPEGVIYRNYIKELDALNAILPPPFIFTGLLTMFHSRMEGAPKEDLDELSEGAHILLGFYVNEDLDRATADSKKLTEWMAENPILDGIKIASDARFYSGIDWWDAIIETTSDSDDSSNDSDDDESSSSTTDTESTDYDSE
jgi:hypothetical protein